MVKSMTGFGKSFSENEGKKISVEVRSLNSKQLDLGIRMPSIFKEKENDIRTLAQRLLERGKIDVFVLFESNLEQKSISINKELAKNYYKELMSLASELNVADNNYIEIVSKMPEVWKHEKHELNEEDWLNLYNTVEKALIDLNIFRADEGKVLANELSNRINKIALNLSAIQKMDGLRVQHIRDRIKNNINEVIGNDKVDSNRFEQELIYYIEKIDITEEKVRLKTHCDYFIKTMEEDSSGRKLGFITQEIGREINTIGSKANDAEIQKLVVEMKDELEKVKEQLLNVL
jgi:uncharacterized protein (TIGR00255 family)